MVIHFLDEVYPKGGFKSEETGGFLHCQNKYSKSLSWAENLNFPPKSVNNNLFKFSAQDSDLEYLFFKGKDPLVSSDFKPPLDTAKHRAEKSLIMDFFIGHF